MARAFGTVPLCVGAVQLSTMSHPDPKHASARLGLEIASLAFLQENPYCRVFRGETPDGPIILKQYKTPDARLLTTEAEAQDFYHLVAADDRRLIDSGAVGLDVEEKLLAICFVAGERFSDLIRRGRMDLQARSTAVCMMGVLGNLLRTFYARTRAPGAEMDPFPFEYLRYSSRQLERLPGLGRAVFRGLTRDADRLVGAFRAARVVPSFAHGDCVFRNIHVGNGRLGLIDFANALARSHVLNDVYNLRFALDNMLLARAYRQELRGAFSSALGHVDVPQIAHEFFYEYHRRRWLMLKLRTRHPAPWAQALRGLLGFARPFRPARMHPC